jgi:hypothetical protein
MKQLRYHRAAHYNRKLAHKLIQDKSLNWLNLTVYREADIPAYAYAVENIIANGLLAIESYDTSSWVFISKTESVWNKTSGIYQHSGFNPTMTMFNAMQTAGFISVIEGTWDTQKRTHYHLTKKMFDLLSEYVPGYKNIEMEWSDEGTCVVKDLNKKFLHRDKKTEKRLKAINEGLSAYSVTLGNKDLRTGYRAVHYIGCGGRIYNYEVQTLPKTIRPNIMIEGEPTCEMDIKSSHMSWLYSKEQVKQPKDHYNVGECIPRPVVKEASVIMLNDKSIRSTKKLLSVKVTQDLLGYYVNYHMNTVVNTEGSKTSNTNSRRGCLGKIKLSACYYGENRIFSLLENLKESEVKFFVNYLINSIKKHHKPIAKYFCADAGRICMGQEGELALRVTEACLEARICVLNVHDSFIIKKTDKQAAIAIIEQELRGMGWTAQLEEKG